MGGFARTTDRPVLLAVAHGSRNPAGVAATRELLERVRVLRPELDVRCCFLDLAAPSLPEALARLADGEPAVLVPLLLGTGYHLRVDIPGALAAARLPHVRLAPSLGPDPLLAAVLADRLAGSGRPPGAGPVVLAAAGSSDPAAAADTRRTARLLAARLGDGRPVVPAYLSAARPTPHEAVEALHAAGHRRVAVATYLLGPGFFADRAAATPARWTSDPLGTHDALARLVAERYDRACGVPVHEVRECGAPACGVAVYGAPACGIPACGIPACGAPACGVAVYDGRLPDGGARWSEPAVARG
ncbi:CbiX/SirB N-terminal domain-containing protein [Streptomyces sp. CB01881]|uniref:CbiX/SirB N-terminal domain-containing protein n=1 Tax=Streptomyces sp. CB01881 TaxID=2078691 RepID=UPI000CDCC09E|nr:CbiX/SirB N-terminal domain-containing protein [Streptomyces sp. CB01881]AUY48579.1 sirohydrochlorin chelatase [Streptomyces sp. CB01881]TYC77069.1 sirohydrochlorin chelatase [Streptomyces sp. CB01881]